MSTPPLARGTEAVRLHSLQTDVPLTVIAERGDHFAGFAPFVPSIDDAGVVAFQASLATGGSGIYTGDGETITPVITAAPGLIRDVVSHPDRSLAGDLCFYAQPASGARAAFVLRSGNLERISDSCGTLGPTMNDQGEVAFRTRTPTGGEAVFARGRSSTTLIAEVGPRIASFAGLPVIHAHGKVLFRAVLRSGFHQIALGDGQREEVIAESGGEFDGLGNFPSINASGAIAFTGIHNQLGAGAFFASAGIITPLALAGELFESVRGVLINDAGPVALFATPHGGTLGIYLLDGPIPRPLLAVGTPLGGSTVAEFALNPVSVNNAGQLAVRLSLDDGRQMVVRTGRRS